MKVLIETSARHIHLTEEHIEALFGSGHKLNYKKELSQPGQFACEERVDIVGAKGTIKNVIILGPARPATQVEVSLTDARALGLTPPVRESGDLDGSAPCKLIGPAGELDLPQGLIAVQRHVHFNLAEAAKIGVRDKQIISVRIDSARPLTFGGVVARLHENFTLAMHIDTDEANACAASGELYGEIIVNS